MPEGTEEAEEEKGEAGVATGEAQEACGGARSCCKGFVKGGKLKELRVELEALRAREFGCGCNENKGNTGVADEPGVVAGIIRGVAVGLGEALIAKALGEL